MATGFLIISDRVVSVGHKVYRAHNPGYKLKVEVNNHHPYFITRHFWLEFDKMYTISCTFGTGAHCDNKFAGPVGEQPFVEDCPNAEVAVIVKNEGFVDFGEGESVRGWVTPDQFNRLVEIVEGTKKGKVPTVMAAFTPPDLTPASDLAAEVRLLKDSAKLIQ